MYAVVFLVLGFAAAPLSYSIVEWVGNKAEAKLEKLEKLDKTKTT